ncbi:hypothetical protein ABZ912_27365 [Nonomuraea angiospora]|uniref:hypothetical protein n=1 Tax=Nonomuraea angiospora TaxID=46172 RepID=UPI0033F90912
MAGFFRPRCAQGAAPAAVARLIGAIRRRDHGGIVLSLTIASALTLTGCCVQAEAARSTAAPRTYTVEQLAAAVGCTAEITLKALDYRQGECTTDGIPYVFLDFVTVDGQRAWLDYAEMYGGLYLVGDRWALSAKSKSFMQELSRKLGGKVEEHGPGGAAPSPSTP